MARTALLTLDDVKVALNVTEPDHDVFLTDLLTQSLAIITEEFGRVACPWQAAQTGRVEKQDGSGRKLFTDYPIDVLTTIKLGYNTASPDDTITGTDLTRVVYAPGGRVITLIDGTTFGQYDWPRYCEVTYNAREDFPHSVRSLLQRTVALFWNTRGLEGMGSVTESGVTQFQGETFKTAYRAGLYRDALFDAVRAEHGRAVFS